MTEDEMQRCKAASELRKLVVAEATGFAATLALNCDTVTLHRLRQIIKDESYSYWQRRLEEAG